jgi:hypothetical protein
LFRTISPNVFDDLLASAPASAAFREEYARHEFLHDRRYIDASVQEGAFHVEGSLRAPAFYTLVLGDLSVEGMIDLRTSYDSGGLFIVIGNVWCEHFISEDSAGVFIDGDLHAGGAVVIAYSDSSFSVVGSLRARLLIGNDQWASVGSGAVIDYGIGYCAALESDGRSGIVRPLHDERATIQALILQPQEEGWPFDAEEIAKRIRSGEPLFK